MSTLGDLPSNILAKEITYLPFSDVQSLCQTSKRIHNFCIANTENSRLIWKNLITNAFSRYSNYGEILEKVSRKHGCQERVCYNYLVYVDFINFLPNETKLDIYRRQGDMESYERVIESMVESLSLIVDRLGPLSMIDKLVFPDGFTLDKPSVSRLLDEMEDMVSESVLSGEKKEFYEERLDDLREKLYPPRYFIPHLPNLPNDIPW